MAQYERPSYSVESLKNQICAIEKRANGMKSEEIEKCLNFQRREELQSMRDYVDGNKHSNEFWFKEGFRAITSAWEREFAIAKAREIISSSKFSHSTIRPDIGSGKIAYLYFIDKKSPTGVKMAGSIDLDDPRQAELLKEKPHCGPTRGSKAWL